LNLITAKLEQKEQRIASQMIRILWDGLCCIYYRKNLYDEYRNKNTGRSDWYAITCNAYLDTAIKDWCQLFGSDKEETHYKKLLNYKNFEDKINQDGRQENKKEVLKNILLGQAEISENEFNSFWKSSIDYRNKYYIHTVHDPEQIKDGDLSVPTLDIPLKTFSSLYLYLIELIESAKINNGHKIYYLKFNDSADLQKMVENTIYNYSTGYIGK